MLSNNQPVFPWMKGRTMKATRGIIFVLMAIIFLMVGQAWSQSITIVQSDVNTAYKFFPWTTISANGSPGFPAANLDLKGPAASGQTWDFSNISISMTASKDTAVQNYISPTGEWHASNFPGATACSKNVQSFMSPPYVFTNTFINYFSSEATGVYDLGNIFRQQINPPIPGLPADTTNEDHIMPKALVLPLPLTYGTSRTTKDSVQTSATEIEISTRMFNVDAFGSVKFPDGITRTAVRVIEDRFVDVYDNGSYLVYARQRWVRFYAKDLTQIGFEVDTPFVGGTTDITSFHFSKQGSTVGVQEISNAIPEQFSLLQNYPNPFNPETDINYQISVAGVVTLKIYDVLGQEVATLIDQELHPGTYRSRWDASAQASGIYYYRLSVSPSATRDRSTDKMVGAFSEVKKMLLVR